MNIIVKSHLLLVQKSFFFYLGGKGGGVEDAYFSFLFASVSNP